MNEEYTYVKTNDVQKDMHDFVKQFGDEINSVSYVGNTIKLKNGVVYRFTYNTIGIRKYYTYIEIYIYHLEFEYKKLRQENKKLKEQLQQKEDIINKSKEHLELKVIRYSNETDYMLDETDLKEIIEILDNKGE